MFEVMDHHLSTGANAPPTPGQASLAEQGRLDRHRVEARHVLFGVNSFDVEAILVSDHLERIALWRPQVQRLL